MLTRHSAEILLAVLILGSLNASAQTQGVPLTAPRPKAGQRVEAWTIATDDTKLVLGATREGQLCLYELSNPRAAWNWTAEPSVFPLLRSAAVTGGRPEDLKWKFKDSVLDKSDGQRLTVRFTCEKPALELKSVWWARPGRGPVRHAVSITNQSAQPVTIFDQPTVGLDLAGPDRGTLRMWTFHTDGGTPDRVGVYCDEIKGPAVNPLDRKRVFSREITTNPNGQFIPYAVFDSGGKQGVYVGIEWSYCRIAAAAAEGDKPGTVRVLGGEFANFSFNLGAHETLEAPPGFVGACQGDVDDAGNSLRRWLFHYGMPEIVRKDAAYPKVQWNAFGATGKTPGSWDPVEKKYYPLIDDIAPLGFEEVMIDVGWWQGNEPDSDRVDWAAGMKKAAEYAHQKGMRFGLYGTDNLDMAKPEPRKQRAERIGRLFREYEADSWRSDCTRGAVLGASYPAIRGFYRMVDALAKEIPGFQWENCSGGGRIKDFGAMRRCVKIFNSDTYSPLDVRKAFYDSSFAFHPAQLEGHLGSTDGRYRPRGTAGMKYAFRSMSMGAPEWFLDAPNGGNGGPPWTQEEKDAVKASVALYKARLRPLVRSADLYHVLPRPDEKHWDGIQYYDPAAGKGVVYVFRPDGPGPLQTIRLKGLDAKAAYRLSFEDRSNPAVSMTGSRLMGDGFRMSLGGTPVSELVWIDRN